MTDVKYQVVERQYAITFHFQSKSDAQNFELPEQYKEKFELNNNLDKDNHKYIRIAQIK